MRLQHKITRTIEISIPNLKLKSDPNDLDLLLISMPRLESTSFVSFLTVRDLAIAMKLVLSKELPPALTNVSDLPPHLYYLVGTHCDVRVDKVDVTYVRAWVQLACELTDILSAFLVVSSYEMRIGTKAVANSITLNVLNIVDEFISDVELKGLTFEMRGPDDMDVTISDFGIDKHQIRPAPVNPNTSHIRVQMRPRQLSVNLGAINADLNVPVMAKMATIFLQSPLMTFNWERTLAKKPKTETERSLSIELPELSVGIPIAPSLCDDVLYIYLSLSAEVNRGRSVVNVRKVMTSFAPNSGGRLSYTILSPTLFSLSVNGPRLVVTTSSIWLSVSALDIASIILMVQDLVKQFNEFFVYEFPQSPKTE
jgi:hypothetical protein